MEFVSTFNVGVDKLNRIIVSSYAHSLFGMYKDRDLECFAYDRACLDLSNQCFKPSLVFIEAKKYSFKVWSRYISNGKEERLLVKRG